MIIWTLAATTPLLAQENIPVFGWQTHFSYQNVKDIAVGTDFTYAATENSLFRIDRLEGSLERFNKNTGLSDVGIGAISVLSDGKTLVVGYKNGNIDFVTEDEIKNITTVKDFETTLSKEFKSIIEYANLLYLSGDLGVVVYDLVNENILEAYQNLGENGDPLAINDLAFANDSIYAATDDGILSASLSPAINRQDFNNWSRALRGIAFEEIEASSLGLHASSQQDLFVKNGAVWEFDQNFQANIVTLEGDPSRLRVSTETRIFDLTNLGSEMIFETENNSSRINNTLSSGAMEAWIASTSQGVLLFNKSTNTTEPFIIPGPKIDQNYQLKFDGEKFWILPSDIFNLNLESHYSTFNTATREWSNIELSQMGSPITQLTDLVAISNRTYVSSFDRGLFSIDENGTIEKLLEGTDGPILDNNSFGLSSLEADENGIIWSTFYDSSESLFTYELNSDTWTNVSPDHPSATFITDILIGPNNDKWLTIDPNEGGGILVYNEGSQRERYLNRNGGQGGLPSNEVTDIEVDQDQFVWVGTSQGIAFFTNPFNILNGGALTASIPIYQNRLLLRNEFITDIVVDPANRKWFGTRNNGLWLFSETGEELIFHFTIGNSPLPSNRIISMEIAPETGELFISTDKGVISFRSDATLGTDSHENIKVYPNPVAPSFRGQIVIEGLVNNAQLRITDASGKLVKKLKANGSTAIWNIRDLNNARVSSGVYLVFSASEDGLETYITKIIVI